MGEENKSKDEQDEDAKRVADMDKTANTLLALIESEKTSDNQKGRLFAQVMAWYKLRPYLIPKEEGSKFKEMRNDVKSKGGKRGRSAGVGGSTSGGVPRSKDGKAIRKIIDSLPDRAGNNSDIGGDPESAERPSGSHDSDGGGIHLNSGSHDTGDIDGAGDRAIV